MQLREHQDLAINMISDSIRRGLKRPVVGAATSFGKTILAAELMKRCQDKGKRGIFICDRVQLTNQTIEKFEAFGINFGVIQAKHDLSNSNAPIQIATAQSLQARQKAGRPLPVFDMAIIDECSTVYPIHKVIAETYNNIPIIGLDATPYSKGLGLMYNNLLVPITPRELLAQGYLAPVRYYGGAHVDLSKVRSTDANTYSAQDLEAATDGDKERLTGAIIENWKKWGAGRQTIAFSPSQNHSKYLVELLRESGISAEHIDCYTEEDERQMMFKAHNAGEFMVLSCSRLLNTGYDAPTVSCIIDCFPVKSVRTFVQRVGRGMRTTEGKQDCVYLDHANNIERFGRAEDIVPTELHDGTKPHKEEDLTNQKDKKESKSRECPQCFQSMCGMSCQACGYSVPVSERMETDGSMLQEITTGTTANKKDSLDDKALFFSEATAYAEDKKYKSGWAYMQYREKYGVNPTMQADFVPAGKMIKGWVKHKNIKRWAGNKKLATLKAAV